MLESFNDTPEYPNDAIPRAAERHSVYVYEHNSDVSPRIMGSMTIKSSGNFAVNTEIEHADESDCRAHE